MHSYSYEISVLRINKRWCADTFKPISENLSGVNESFAIQRRFAPKGPLVNSEFYPGWLGTYNILLRKCKYVNKYFKCYIGYRIQLQFKWFSELARSVWSTLNLYLEIHCICFVTYDNLRSLAETAQRKKSLRSCWRSWCNFIYRSQFEYLHVLWWDFFWIRGGIQCGRVSWELMI
jgi:hypothetical protein